MALKPRADFHIPSELQEKATQVARQARFHSGNVKLQKDDEEAFESLN